MFNRTEEFQTRVGLLPTSYRCRTWKCTS